MADKVFPKGVFAFPPRQGAPDFVVGSLVVTLEDFKAFVNGDGKQYLSDYNGKKQLRLQLTKTRDGKLSVSVDTYKKDEQAPANKHVQNNAADDDNSDSLPF